MQPANDTEFLLTFSGHRFINILSELSRLEPHYLITTSMWNFVELTLKYLVLNSLLSFSLKLLRSIICINFTKRFNFDVTGNSSMIQAKICTKYRKHWKNNLSFQLSGQTGPFLAVLKISAISYYFSCFHWPKKIRVPERCSVCTKKMNSLKVGQNRLNIYNYNQL